MSVSDNNSRNKIVEKNMGLVHSCANKFKGRGVEYDDLFQAGCLGLIKAAEKFDPERGFSFSTYAVPVILGEIKRIFRDGGSVKVGRALKEQARQALKEKERLANELNREPTIEELSKSLGVDSAQTALLLNAAMPTISLTADDENGQLDVPVESHAEKVSDYIALKEVLSELSETDRELIKLRYFSRLTQSKTAARLGMSQVQVSRREKAVLSILRKNLSA